MGVEQHLHFVLQAAQVLGGFAGLADAGTRPPILNRMADDAVQAGGGQAAKQLRGRQPLAWAIGMQLDAVLFAIGLHGQAQVITFGVGHTQSRWRRHGDLALGHMPMAQREHRPGFFAPGVQAQGLGAHGCPRQ